MTENLLEMVKTHCIKNNITLICDERENTQYPDSGQACLGYFIVKGADPVLAVATKNDYYEGTLLHEYNHSCQWLENASVWTENYLTCEERHKFSIALPCFETLDLIHLWIDNKIEIDQCDLVSLINRAISVELDCEKRTTKMGSQYIHEFDVIDYMKQANAYLRTYKFTEMSRKWVGYDDQFVIQSQLDSFEQDYFAPLNDKEVELYKKLL